MKYSRAKSLFDTGIGMATAGLCVLIFEIPGWVPAGLGLVFAVSAIVRVDWRSAP
jgi:hypothetical protein